MSLNIPFLRFENQNYRSVASKTVTLVTPFSWRCLAVDRPAIPAPMTMTLVLCCCVATVGANSWWKPASPSGGGARAEQQLSPTWHTGCDACEPFSKLFRQSLHFCRRFMFLQKKEMSFSLFLQVLLSKPLLPVTQFSEFTDDREITWNKVCRS